MSRLKPILAICLTFTASGFAKQKQLQHETLTAYLERMQQQVAPQPSGSLGSLWSDSGKLVNLTADYKAAHVGDLITIVVSQGVTANNANTVATARTFNANSGISALPGHLKTSGVQSLFSPTSSQTLNGKSQATTTSTLQTTLSGRVVAILNSNTLVIEAERQLTMNNEKQTVLLRGLVRTGDIGPENSVASNAIANLELELKGKGVLSDGTRPPNPLIRGILRIIGF